MSTEGFPAVRRIVGFALGVAVLTPPAFAAQVDFRPVLSFGVFHTGNVQIIGEDTIGDDAAAIAADLSVERTTASSTFSFLYQARYVGYRQYSGLDYLGNDVTVNYSNEVSRRTSVRASGGVSRTDSQGISGASVGPQGDEISNVDRPLTFVPRTTITRWYAAASGSVGAGRRSLVDWGVRAGVNRFDEVSGVDFNNNTSAEAAGGWRYELSERTALGLGVGFSWFGFEASDNSVGESLFLAGTHQLGRSTTMAFNVGATRTTTADFSSTSGTMLLSFERTLTAGSQLNAGVRQSVTAGTGLQAATNDSGAWVSYSQSSPGKGLSWALNGVYWFRRTLPAANVTTTNTGTLNLSGALGCRFSRFLSLSAAYAYSYQNDQSDSSSSLNTRYASYGLFLVWTIRGETGSTNTGARFRTGH